MSTYLLQLVVHGLVSLYYCIRGTEGTAAHGDGLARFGTARFRSPSPRQRPISTGYKTFLDWLRTLGRKEGTFGKSLGQDSVVGGVLRFTPMIAVVRLVGWLDRSSRDAPNVPVLLAELRKWRGRGPMSAPAGRDGWVISGRKGQKVKGSWVSCRGSQSQTDRDGQTWKGNKKGT